MIKRAAEIAFFTIWTAATVLISYWLGQQAYTWMPPEATREAEAVDSLFSFLVALGSVVFLGVFGMIAHSIIVCRAERGDFSEGHPARGSARLEVLWTAIPTVLVLWIAVQGYHIYTLLDIEGQAALTKAPVETSVVVAATSLATAKEPALLAAAPLETIEVTAKQWAWSFRYADQNVTSPELHLPLDRKARLILKSEDVLHGFYVPAFRIKQDIIPNQKIELMLSPQLAGQYRLHDSQFSGAYFALMEADVYVESPESYRQWLAEAALQPKVVSNLAAAEHANPPPLWGQHWAVRAPDDFFKSALNAKLLSPAFSAAPNL